MDKQTIDIYNLLAKEYDEETVDFWNRFPRTFIDTFAERVQGTVLNVGSGPGRDGLLLQEKGLDVTCLDASEAMVELSTARGLKSVVADFSAIPFADASFDGVWAYTSLLHIPKAEIDSAIAEIKRVLKPNGIFGLGMIEGDTELYRESSGVNQPRWFSFYTKPEIESLFGKHGFEIEYFEAFKPGSKNYLNFISRKV